MSIYVRENNIRPCFYELHYITNILLVVGPQDVSDIVTDSSGSRRQRFINVISHRTQWELCHEVGVDLFRGTKDVINTYSYK